MQNEVRVASINVKDYFTSIGLGLKWYNYEDLKKVSELRRATTAVGYLPKQLVHLVAEDAEHLGLAA